MTASRAHIRLAPGMQYIGLDDGYLLYDGGELRLLAGTAAHVFENVDGVSTAQEIAHRVSATFVGDTTETSAEIVDFLDFLARTRVLRTSVPLQGIGYVRPANIGYAPDDSVCLLINLATGRRRALSSTGARVWELICAYHFASEVVERLRLEFADKTEHLADQVQDLLTNLAVEGFLERRGGWPDNRTRPR